MSLTRRTLLLAKIEATYGVDAVPAVATDFIPITSITPDPNISTVTRELFRDSLSPVAPVAGKRYMTVTFSTDIVGNGLQQDGTTESFMVRLFEACKCLSTPTVESAAGAGDGSFLLTPASTTSKSLTLYLYVDGILYKILGARGTAKATLDANALGKLDFVFTGLFSSPTDSAIPTIPAVSAINPPLIKSVGLTMGGSYVPVLSSFEVDLANKVVQRDDMNAATGVSDIEITGRDPTGSLNPDLMLAAQYDVWSNFLAMTPQAITGSVGATAGNIFQLSIPAAVYDSVGIGDRDGVRIYDIKFTPTGSDDEIAITLK